MKNKIIFLISLLYCVCFQSEAQVSTYAFSESISSTYTPLSTFTNLFSTPWDDQQPVLVNLGFNFEFDGTIQTQCYISPNGYITFGTISSSNMYTPLSDALIYSNGGVISALAIDLISTSDNIVYSTIGTAPNRVFVSQWTNANRKVSAGNFNFQIRLNESSNTIELWYGLCSPSNVSPVVYNVQVGIRGENNDIIQGNINNRYQTGGNVNFPWFTKTNTGVLSSNTIRTSTSEYPNNNLKYTFTPSLSCVSPTGIPSNIVIGNSGITSNSFVGNSFTNAIPSPSNYLILRSTINIPPSSSDIPNRYFTTVNNIISSTYTIISNSNATSFTQTGLLSNTTYYYWVIPFSSNCLGAPIYNLSNMITSSQTTCIDAPIGLITSTIGGNSFIATWTPVNGAIDYVIDVSTNNAFTALLPGYSSQSTINATSIQINGLNPVTTYYYRVRAIGISCNTNSTTTSVTTICGSYTIPYFQNFDTTAILSLPTCMSVSDNNSDSNSWQVKNTFFSSSPNSYHLNTNTLTNSNDWFFTPGLILNTGVTYRLKFKYNTKSSVSFAENLKIRLGNSQSESNMNITLLDLPNLVNTIYQTAIVDFSIVTTGDYYVGFQGYSFSGQSSLIIDDVSIIVSPTCYEPSNISVDSVGINSASISWNASVPSPFNGYEYYLSNTNITPIYSVTPNGSVGSGVTSTVISGLNPATLYYIWVRGNCGSSDKSVWSYLQSFTTDCTSAALLTVQNGTLCGGGTTTLQATATAGSTIEWYSDSSGISLVGTGNNFITPNLNSTTTYYVQSKVSGGLIKTGPISPNIHGGALGIETSQTSINFSTASNTTLISIDVFPITAGEDLVISIVNSSNYQLGIYNFITNEIGGNIPQTISFGLNLIPGSYRMIFDTVPNSGMAINVDNTVYPFSSSIASILGNTFDNTYYLYGYNWKFSNVCKSLLTPVLATVTVAPMISFSNTSSVICKGETTNLVTVSGFNLYDTFNWSPNSIGISGNVSSGFTFQPTSNIVYAFTASQSAGNLCSRTIFYTITVKPEPPAINIIPPSATVCQGEILTLNASLAAAPPVTIFEENFNSSTNNWIKINNSIGGNVAATAWILRNSPYNNVSTSSSWNINFSSNDSSQFYFSNSDASGPSGSNRTITILESPSFSMVGFTSANLSFYHYLRYVGGNTAIVQSSTNGGSSWTTLNAYYGSQGASSNFVNSNINISSLIGNPNVKLRFYYDATWDWGWAIDNIKITGPLALEVTWLPNQDLYTNSAATVPYITGTPASIIYTKPNSNITYSGTVVGSSGCSTSNITNLTVIPSVVVGTLSSNQVICSGAPNNLVLSGYSGTIIRWEFANDALFTSGVTPIANLSNTLTSIQIGLLTADRYYRVVLQNSTCPVVYSNIISITTPTTTWNGTVWSNGFPDSNKKVIFNGNYNSTANISACSVQVLSGNIIINSAHNLIVQNEVNVQSGLLQFNNNSSLVQVNTLNNFGIPIVNTGNITYQRFSTPMIKFDYTYWSSPVTPQVLGTLSPLSPYFYEYNPSISNWAIASSSSNMVSGKGYLIRAPFNYNEIGPAAVFTANFQGIPNTGTFAIPILGSSNQFNLIGNPYPSSLSADLFLSDPLNVSKIDGTIYLWTHNTPISANQYTSNDYAMYNYSGGIGTVATNSGINNSIPNGKIASGQGFFIKGLTNGNANFTNGMRLIGNNNMFFRTESNSNHSSLNDIEKHRFWLDIFNSNGAFKQLLVAYIENATNEIDRGFDGDFIDAGNPINIYVIQDNIKLSIQGKALPFNSSDIIPLGYKSNLLGDFEIKLSEFDGLFENQEVYLVDNLLNISHNLRSSNYSFSSGIGIFDSRFEVHFISNTLGNNINTFEKNSVIVYKNNNNNFVVKSKVEIDSIEIYDVRGRKLISKDKIISTEYILSFESANQVVLIKVKTIDGEIVTKKAFR